MEPEFFISKYRLTGVQLVGSFCSSIPVLLFDNPGIFNFLNTLFQLSHYLCFNIGIIYDLFLARDTWMS